MKFRWPWTTGHKKPQSQSEAGMTPRKRKPKRAVLEMMALRTEKLKIRTDNLKAQARFEEYKRHLDQVKRGEDDKADELHIELGDLRRIDKMIRPLGMKIMNEKGGDALEDDDGFSSVLKTIAQNLGAGAAAMLMQKQGAMVAQPQAYAQPQLPPASVAIVTAPVSEAPTVESEQPPMPQEGNMVLIAQYIRASLENKDPEQAARWLLSQNRDEARQLVRMLCAITDEQIPAALSKVEQEQPSLASLVQWFRSRSQWTLDTVRAIRVLAAATEQKTTSVMGL